MVKLSNKILKKTLYAGICLVLILHFTLTPVQAGTAQTGLVELFELALELNPQIVEAKLELEKAHINLQVSTGQTQLQAVIEGELARGYKPLPGDFTGKVVDLWSGNIVSKTSTYLPTGAQLSLLAEWNDYKTVEATPEQGDGEPSYTIQINQPLFRPINTLTLWQGISLNERGVQQKKFELAKTKRDVVLAVLEGYLSAWEKQEQLASVERRLAWASQELTRIEQDLAVGNATQLDFLESHLRHSELTIEKQVACMNYTRTLEDLSRIVGVDGLEVSLEPLQDLAFLSALGLEGLNPELELAKLAIATNEQSYTKIKAENSWQSSIQGYYTKDGNWQLSLSLQLPIFDSAVATNQEKISQLQLQQSQDDLETITKRVQRKQKELLEDTKVVAERLKLAEESLALAEKRKEIINLREELGAVSFTERYNIVEQWETAYLRLVALKKQYQLLEAQGLLL